MKRLVVTRAAYCDLAAEGHYIAEENVDAANKVRDDIEAAAQCCASSRGWDMSGRTVPSRHIDSGECTLISSRIV
jgi:plasmid stabilization system protein ParE